MTPTDESRAGSTRWLDEREMAAWLPLVRLVTLLPQGLDRQLREDAGIPHVYYQVLATLSGAPEQAVRMSELARLTGTSLSRLSHAVSSLEQRGWVTRTTCADDRRAQLAALTDGGRALLAQVAPGHVAEVRRLVFDRLSPEQVDQLADIARALLDPRDRP